MKKLIYFSILVITVFIISCDEDSSTIDIGSQNGKAGSLARFAATNNVLYIVGKEDLQVIDISNAENPTFSGETNLGIGIETIFPYQNNLFIGTQTGMLIYDSSNPLNPEQLSVYSHITSCDPVVVQGNYAYVTLRSGTNCRFGENLLEVIDISDLENPELATSYPMSNPHGLGVDDDRLFVTEGNGGIKIFDISETPNLLQIEEINEFNGFDVIPNNGILLVIGNDGLYQYEYRDNNSLKFLSKMEVGN